MHPYYLVSLYNIQETFKLSKKSNQPDVILTKTKKEQLLCLKVKILIRYILFLVHIVFI